MPDNTDPMPIVPPEFEVPLELREPNFVLRPLGPEHNPADHQAWTSSIEHIQSTPGFGPPHNWPPSDGMALEDNLADLKAHRRDFQTRTGFTYTVLDRVQGDADGAHPVIGCVYIYGDSTGEWADDDLAVEVRSWVVADRSELDRELWSAVSEWLETSWPFTSIRYAPRRP